MYLFSVLLWMKTSEIRALEKCAHASAEPFYIGMYRDFMWKWKNRNIAINFHDECLTQFNGNSIRFALNNCLKSTISINLMNRIIDRKGSRIGKKSKFSRSFCMNSYFQNFQSYQTFPENDGPNSKCRKSVAISNYFWGHFWFIKIESKSIYDHRREDLRLKDSARMLLIWIVSKNKLLIDASENQLLLDLKSSFPFSDLLPNKKAIEIMPCI